MANQGCHGPVSTSVASPSDAWLVPWQWCWHFLFPVFRTLASGIVDSALDVENSWYIGIGVVFTAVTAITFSPVVSLAVAMAWILLPYFDLLYFHVTYVIPNFLRTVGDIRRCQFDSAQSYWVAHCHCAQCSGAAVGMVAAKRIDDDTLELLRMYVKPELRRHGIAGKLCYHVLDFAKRSGYQEIHLFTLGRFSPAVNLYRKFGYELVERTDYPHMLFPIRANERVKMVKRCAT